MSRLVSPLFAGREVELGVLARAFDDVCAGTPGAVVVGAEAGGGKSRLIREFTLGVADRALVLTGACVEQREAALPYAPFTAALRQLVSEVGLADVTELLDGVGTTELALLLPEFGAPPAGLDPPLARARLFEVVLRLLERLARRQPVVLVVDDLHWADHSTRDLLGFLVCNLRSCAVLVVTAYRSEELVAGHPLRPLLAELDRTEQVVSLSLPRLSRREVAAQLEGILGHYPRPEVAAAVHERGEGVPLFTEAVIAPGGTVRSELPGSLRDLLLRVVHELPEPTQRILRAVAVGGVRVGHALLATVAGGDGEAALRPAVTAQVLVGDADGYAFRHGLIQEAVRDDLLPGERAALHRAYAQALEKDPELAAGTRVSVAVVLHWAGAQDHTRALRAAWRAATDPEGNLSYPEQLQMAEQVLRLWDRVPQAAAVTGTAHVDVLELAADAACWIGEAAERGLAYVDAALTELDEANDAERVAGLLVQRAPMRQQRLLPGHLEDLTEALRLATGPTPVRAECLGQLSRALLLRDRCDQARQLTDELSAVADTLADPALQVEALVTHALLRARGGEDSTAELREATRAARSLGAGWVESLARTSLVDVLHRRGDHAQAIEAARVGLTRTVEVGQAPYLGWAVAQGLAQGLISAGRWDEARAVLDEALATSPSPYGRATLLLCQGQVAVARGDMATASRVLDELGGLSPQWCPESRRVLPLLRLRIDFRLADGDPAGALTVAATVPEHGGDADPRYLWPLLATALRAYADAGSAAPPAGVQREELLLALESVAGKLSRPGPVEQAHAHVVAGELSRAHGKPARSSWDLAAEAWARLGEPYQEAYALLRAAAADSGDRSAVAERLRRAAQLATTLAAEPLLDQLTALARRARVPLPGAGRAATDAPFRLTAREWEVLRLVAAGRSNPEIATELFISAKTASVHVSNILAKLDVPSRAAATAAAHRLHLFDPS